MAQQLNNPQVLYQPLAENGDKNTIPNTNDPNTGNMSMELGFPPITSEDINNGGIPPNRTDFNGAFNLLSQQHFFLQNGGTYTFRQDISNAIGGYPKDCVLYYKDPDGTLSLVRSLVGNNSLNFITNPEYIDGVNWEKLGLGSSTNQVGQIIQVLCGPDYVPLGALPCDGSIYGADRFSTLWDNYLTNGSIATCSMDDYSVELSNYGQCLKFGIDQANRTFRVPLIKDGTHLQQALSDGELSRFHPAGAPSLGLTLSTAGSHTHTRGTMNITGATGYRGANASWYSGAFYGRTDIPGGTWDTTSMYAGTAYFDASRNWTGATSNNGSHTHTINSSNPVYGKSNTIQPTSFGIRHFVVVANAVKGDSYINLVQWNKELEDIYETLGDIETLINAL